MVAQKLCVLAICCTGRIVLESTMSQWFNHAFPVVWGQLHVQYLIPYNKFRLHHMEKVWEYLEHISKIIEAAEVW